MLQELTKKKHEHCGFIDRVEIGQILACKR